MAAIEGVLLYYRYYNIGEDPSTLLSWLMDRPWARQLVGRIRVSSEGLNATLGGSLVHLQAHVLEMREIRGFDDVDFKLDVVDEELQDRVKNAALCKACGFDRLRCRIVKEIVSFGETPSLDVEPERLSAHAWDKLIESPDAVIVDVRNSYESAIGGFEGSLTPDIRTTSQFPHWLDGHSDLLTGKCVLTYCTGGVRCEMATRLIATRTACARVATLQGGVLGYLREGGNNFRGRLFVFDPRVSIPAGKMPLASATCLYCSANVPDYCCLRFKSTDRARCARCRILLLLCEDCRDESYNDDVLRRCSTCDVLSPTGRPRTLSIR